MRRTLALAVLLLALPASARAAAVPLPPVRHVVDLPFTDGRALAAWERQGAVRTLADDQPLGGETLTPPPAPGCALGGANATALAFDCPDRDSVHRIWLRDRATGASRPTALTYTQGGAGGQWYSLNGVGAAIADIHNTDGYHVDAGDHRFRLSDGGSVPADSPSARRVASLDDPSGSVALCAPLTIGTHRVDVVDDLFGTTGRVTVRDAAVYRAPWLLTIHRGRVLLKRCGTKRVRDFGPAADDRTPMAITGHYVAWATPYVRIVRFADLRKLTYRWLGLGDHDLRLAATDRRLWAGDAKSTFLIEP